jgi:hypothetical protein
MRSKLWRCLLKSPQDHITISREVVTWQHVSKYRSTLITRILLNLGQQACAIFSSQASNHRFSFNIAPFTEHKIPIRLRPYRFSARSSQSYCRSSFTGTFRRHSRSHPKSPDTCMMSNEHMSKGTTKDAAYPRDYVF